LPNELAVYVLALIARTAAGLALPVLLARAVDVVLHQGTAFSDAIWQLAGCLVLLGIAEVVADLSSAYAVSSGTGRRRVQIVEHLLAVGPTARWSVGDAVGRVIRASADAASAPVALASAIVALTGSTIAVISIWAID
jgi:ATP-binding cassette subfamily B protein